ncbi:MAG: 6-hydroxymethylpterin diphosphokinase MptE-like protein [bacterium]
MATDRVEILDTRSPGNPTLLVHMPDKDVLIHSKFDPAHDAKRWSGQQKINADAKYLIVFGFGLGYHIEALLEENPKINKIFVFEVSPDIFRAALAARDLSGIFSENRVCLLVGNYQDIEESIFKFLNDFSALSTNDSSPEILIHRPSLDVFPDGSENLRDILEYIKLATTKQGAFSEEREFNKTANKQAFESARGIVELRGSYTSREMIVAAAGPSLDISIELLKASPAAPDIIAVDSALAPLLRAGIHPRFVVTGDPQTKTIDLFHGLPIENEELVFFPTSNPEVVALFPHERRWAAYSSLSDDEILLDNNFEKGQLFFSGTVLLAAVDFAVKTCAKPTVLIGADFSFHDDQTHATGSRTQGYSPRYGRIREVMGLHNTTVKTSDVLYLYLKDLERYYLNMEDQHQLFNATSRGAAVFHVPYISFELFLAKYSAKRLPG